VQAVDSVGQQAFHLVQPMRFPGPQPSSRDHVRGVLHENNNGCYLQPRGEPYSLADKASIGRVCRHSLARKPSTGNGTR
jgi:hypothetical protein